MFLGLAVFSLLVSTVVFTLITLLGLKPWQGDTIAPPPRPPAFAMGVGEAVALPGRKGPSAAVAHASVAAGSKAEHAARLAGRHDDDDGAGTGTGANVVLAVAPARAVAVGVGGGAEPAPEEPEPSPEAQPVATPVQPPASAPPAAGGPSGGPIRAGVEPEPICEGDEYVITVSLADAGEGPEPALLDIVLRRFGADGSVEELHLEGDLSDAQSLAVLLVSEGNCVAMQVPASKGDGTAEGADPAVPEASSLEFASP